MHDIIVNDKAVIVRTDKATVTVRLDNKEDYLVAVNRDDDSGPTEKIGRNRG